MTEGSHKYEANARFAFGSNWARFLQNLDEERIKEAERSLTSMLDVNDLKGKRFLDVGSGSGLFSLAARRLGARVHSFDYDPESVACTRELRRRFFEEDGSWMVEQGTVLDADYLKSLGSFDVVYAWGVLHHTGGLWRAMQNVCSSVSPDGKLFLAIYNHQEPWTAVWTLVKRLYNRLPRVLRIPYVLCVLLAIESKALAYSLLTLNPRRYVALVRNYSATSRGMSRWRDAVDWIGGYPFEAARPDEVFEFCKARGFLLQRLKTCGARHGCNEFVFHLGNRQDT